MATATKHTKLVEKVITETATSGFTLELSPEEAKIILKIFNKVGGDSHARSIMGGIRTALVNAGVVFNNGTPSDYKDEEIKMDGYLYFIRE